MVKLKVREPEPSTKKSIKLKTYIKNDIVKVDLTANKQVRAKVVKADDDYVYVKYLDKEVREEFGNQETAYQHNKVRKTFEVNNQKKNGINPEKWVLPNKKSFPAWINETFLGYRLTNSNNKNKSNDFELRKTQKFVRDYLQIDSPYRGLLLYHGLGSGKTCSSIAVAENLVNQKNVIVMLPASLRSNYVKALQSTCGNPRYKANPALIKDRYTFVSYNASNAVTQLERIGSLDNHVIIVDEIHNLISMMTGNSKQGPAIYDMLMNAKNVKLVFLSGTPIINIPFETAKLFNLLRGYIEVHQFAVRYVGTQYGKTWKMDTFEEKLKQQIPEVDYVEINTIGRNMNMTLKTVKSYSPEFNAYINEIIDLANHEDVTLEYKDTKKVTLFPDDREEFDSYFVDDSDPRVEKMKNAELYLRRILGLVSYYRGASDKYYPTVKETELIEVPMSNYQHNEYEAVRAVERKIEKGSSGKSKGKKGLEKKKVTSVFRTFSRQYSNFVFPETIERPFKSKLFSQRKKKKNENENNNSQNVSTFKELEKAEDIANSNRELTKSEKVKIEIALSELDKQRDQVLKDLGPDESDGGLAKYSPKMREMLMKLNDVEGIALVYSTYRTLEGIEIFSKALETNGYQKFGQSTNNSFNYKRFAIWSGQEDEKEKEKILEVLNSYENRNGELIKILMITAAGAEGLDLKNVRSVHIMEPFWHEIRIDQVIGRAVRLMSHHDLDPADRTVEVYRYFSIMTPEQLANSAEKVTTDQHIFDVALKKLTIVNDIKKLMKVGAVDCFLNAKDNEKDIQCFTFAQGETGNASKPEISKNAIHVIGDSARKTTNRKLELMFMDSNKRVYYPDRKNKKIYYYRNYEKQNAVKAIPKNLKKIAVNKNTNEAYDYNAAKQKNPIKLGDINTNGIVK